MEKKDGRGGKRAGAGRPFRDKEKGRMNKHGITMHDDVWESITIKASELNLSASQYLIMLHNEYIKNKGV